MENRLHKRIEGLDILRGIFAFSIVIAHYVHWSNINVTKFFQNYLEKMSFIGVDGFFILSGFVIFLSYYTSGLPKRNDSIKFYIKRWLRIAPLFLLVDFFMISHQITTTSFPFLNISVVLSCLILICILPGLSITLRKNCSIKYKNTMSWILLGGLFTFIIAYFSLTPHKLGVIAMTGFIYGFWNPADSMGGGWSIGNEFVFYYLFPIMLTFMRSTKGAVIILIFVAFETGLFGYLFSPDAWNYHAKWSLYTRFEYHAICFCIGVCAAHIFMRIDKIKWSKWGLIGFSSLWLILQYYANPSYGIGRLLFLLDITGVVFIMAYLTIRWKIINKILLGLGDISYTIFLMAFPLKNIFNLFSLGSLGVAINIFIVLFVSVFIYHFYEKLLINFGRSPILKLSKSSATINETSIGYNAFKNQIHLQNDSQT